MRERARPLALSIYLKFIQRSVLTARHLHTQDPRAHTHISSRSTAAEGGQGSQDVGDVDDAVDVDVLDDLVVAGAILRAESR